MNIVLVKYIIGTEMLLGLLRNACQMPIWEMSWLGMGLF